MSDHAHTATAEQPAPAAPPTPPARPDRPPQRAEAALSWLVGAIPTFLGLAVLVGAGIWGYRSDWKLPSLAGLFGEQKKEKDDWCEEHAVPESVCVECNPALLPAPPTYGWCEKHGVHDCPLDHPDVAQLPKVPRITPQDLDRAARSLAYADRPRNDKDCKLHPRRVQLASDAAAERAGIKTATVAEETIEEGVKAAGEITYDHPLVARLSSRLPGTVWRVVKNLGDPVKRGDVVVVIDAAEVGRTKAEYLQAVAQLDVRSRALQRITSAGAVVSEAKRLELEGAVKEARIRILAAQQALVNLGLPVHAEDLKGLTPEELARRLQFLGLPPALVQGLDPERTTASLLPVRSPLDGVVVSCETVAGEVTDPTKVLQVVADNHEMLLTLDVRQEDAGRMKLGQEVEFRPDGSKGELKGRVNWISTAVDMKTRTLKVHALFPNKDGRLKSNTFGSGMVVTREEKVVVVPNEAIHSDGECSIVFVRDKNYLTPGAPKVFHARSVRLGARTDEATEIIAGVLPGEVVATEGSAVLRGQLLKTSLPD